MPFSLSRARAERSFQRELRKELRARQQAGGHYNFTPSLVTGDMVSKVHLPQYLLNISVGFSNPALIAERICPTIPVDKQSDKYIVDGRDVFQTGENRWSPGTVPNSMDSAWDDDTFTIDIRKQRHPIYSAQLKNADAALNLRAKFTRKVTNRLDLNHELRVYTLFTTAANYGSSNKLAKSGGSEWDQSSVIGTAQPILDMQGGIEQASLTAMVPPKMLTVVMSQQTFDIAIKNNTAILDRIKYTQTGVVTEELLATLLGVKEVILSSAISTGSGPVTAGGDVITGFTPAYMWGDGVWIGFVGDTSIEVPWFARTLAWIGMAEEEQQQAVSASPLITNPSIPNGSRVIAEYPMDDLGKEGNWIEGKEARLEQIGTNQAGYLITNTLSTV